MHVVIFIYAVVSMRFDDIFLVLLHGLSDCTKRDGLPRLGFCCGSTSMCLPFEAGLIFIVEEEENQSLEVYLDHESIMVRQYID